MKACAFAKGAVPAAADCTARKQATASLPACHPVGIGRVCISATLFGAYPQV
jgi:hypothetical protein